MSGEIWLELPGLDDGRVAVRVDQICAFSVMGADGDPCRIYLQTVVTLMSGAALYFKGDVGEQIKQAMRDDWKRSHEAP